MLKTPPILNSTFLFSAQSSSRFGEKVFERRKRIETSGKIQGTIEGCEKDSGTDPVRTLKPQCCDKLSRTDVQGFISDDWGRV